jgi:hypothetical protein
VVRASLVTFSTRLNPDVETTDGCLAAVVGPLHPDEIISRIGKAMLVAA